MRVFLSQLKSLFRRRALEERLDEEVKFHLEMEAANQRRNGVSSKDSEHAARRAFGSEQLIKETYRDQRGLPMFELLFKDLQYGVRMMLRSPGFTLIAVLSLALGIGANTAIFTLINAVLLRSLPVQNPNELVAVGNTARPGGVSNGGPRLDVLSYPLYQRLRDHNQVFTGLMASGRAGRVDAKIDGAGEEPVRGRLVSDNYFEVLGLRAARGRTFASGDDQKPNPIVVISYDYWQNRFAANPEIIGRTLDLNAATYSIVGVAPAGFTGEVVGSAVDVWIPLAMQPQLNPGDGRLTRKDSSWLLLIGRLKPAVTFAQASAEIKSLSVAAVIEFAGGPSLKEDQLREIRSQTINVEPGAKGFSGLRSRFRQPLLILMCVVGLVLLIACANVANLLLARATTRQKEISVRLAVGASRFRLVRQLLTESVLLAALGGVAGIILSWAASGLLLRLASNRPTPIPLDVRPDSVMLVFTAAVSLLTGIIFGLAPALRSTRVELAHTLKESARSLTGSKGWQLGKLLVVGQVALSVLLLVGAGLFVRTLINLETLDVGYQPSHLVVVDTDAIGSGFSNTRQQALANQMIERLSAMPGTDGVTVSANGIFNGTESTSDSISVDGYTSTRREDTTANFNSVGPHYFRVVGVPLIAGRDFDEHDRAGSPPVTILNETIARFYFGNTDPIGKVLHNDNERYQIVGVVKDMKEQQLRGKTERRFYKPFFQVTDHIPDFRIEIRLRGDELAALPAIRREIQSIEPSLKITGIDPVRTLLDRTIVDERLIAQLSGFFGALALLLAATGLYGVMAYTISRRANEIGLRIALGADKGVLIRMVLRETFGLVAIGIAVGIPVALAATRLIASSLVGLSANDPATLAIAVIVMLVVALLAAWIPARRAANIDPLLALRQD